jgi:hypothetical protein
MAIPPVNREYFSCPSEGDSGEPNYTTPAGFPICAECGKSTRNRNTLVCAPCRWSKKEQPEARALAKESTVSIGRIAKKKPAVNPALIKFEDIPKHLGLGANLTVVNSADIKFLHSIGALDWSMAGLICFQHFIHDHGTKEEQDRTRALNVGYPSSW